MPSTFFTVSLKREDADFLEAECKKTLAEMGAWVDKIEKQLQEVKARHESIRGILTQIEIKRKAELTRAVLNSATVSGGTTASVGPAPETEAPVVAPVPPAPDPEPAPPLVTELVPEPGETLAYFRRRVMDANPGMPREEFMALAQQLWDKAQAT